eukprot:CAMPEP_0185585192 /NCGR_PEP_ID=MMETSP0434-20130131/37147_1 /TAXON_ID=626734 ORGANISM="Favella taraikaensis, Strain Fe Narragansett Bay" /NCGR_SAMPLE_ID=MMETSP0434 /ASSEMBLY_ACC=CAM_ASM_000379 /LENGTH=133 /DNA_ID=CAMNT_0028205369 /DNA_START=251 /DNA_END=652 /DNA_ORIENTATION=-
MSKYRGTIRCEAYDTASDQWLTMQALPFFCVNTSAVVMRNRFIYLMPGSSNEETQAQNSLMMGYLDTGTIERGFDPMTKAQWAQLVVKNVDFFNAGPVAGIPLGPDSMVIFGGQSSKTFLIEDCQAEVNPKTG